MKIISTIENFLVSGIWLPLMEEVEILESDLEKYINLPGVKVVEEAKNIKTEL